MRIASDVGGTFTDSIAYDEATRRITVSKVSTTPQNRALGTIEGLKRALDLQGKTGVDVEYVGHGMTTATNAVIQRKGALTAFVTNAGFRDLLLIGRQDRPSLYDITTVRAPQLVAREHCYTVTGRIDAAGLEVTPLSQADLERVAESISAAGIESVAITFLHAYANPTHERAARDFLTSRLPGVVICASTDIMAEFREYERASTTVLNAFLMPVMDRYLGSLVRLLEDPVEGLGMGQGKPVMVMEAAGGLMTVDFARARPVHTVLSGPAGGVVGSAYVAGLAGISDIITMDIGGTSTDISLIRGGRPEITRQATLERIPIRLPVIDINAIGAGGGSIAWIDEGGALRVGPMSAEAIPGPACYRRGGQRPTVTDANVVLGRFSALTKLGDDMTLDIDASYRVVEEHIGRPLGLDVTEAAAGILRVAHSNIVRGIRVVSVERGYDPRDFALVPFGGAGPMHGTPVARDLSMRRLLIPPSPGILCALGQLVSDLRHDLLETHIAPLAKFPLERAAAIMGRLRERGHALLAADQVALGRRRIEIRADLRYVGQSYELPLPLADDQAWASIEQAFHTAHAQRFGHADANAAIEVVGFAAVAVGLIDTPTLPRLEEGDGTAAAERGVRKVFFESDKSAGAWHVARVFAREHLLAGNRIVGPAIIEEVSATTVLYPGDVALTHASGSLIVEVGK